MNPEATGELVITAVIGMIYFFPTIMAYQRDHVQRSSILALNLFLGWTVIGWVGALVWTMYKPAKT
ncbi:MAG: hypothetical protein OJF51_001867 [Nitrospira sp.]|jgi:hypothetical protein|nr:MAG: hypothetical protein OJF51_001867 [Nitrospira sp.]